MVEKIGGTVRYISCGVILTEKNTPSPDRLESIYRQLNAVIAEHQPDEIATEQLFFSNNVTTALQVGRTIGVVLLTAAQKGLPWTEYRPAEVKMAVAGYGAAEKKQVQYMVKQLLNLDKVPKPDDAADALAIAICHAHSATIKALERR